MKVISVEMFYENFIVPTQTTYTCIYYIDQKQKDTKHVV